MFGFYPLVMSILYWPRFGEGIPYDFGLVLTKLLVLFLFDPIETQNDENLVVIRRHRREDLGILSIHDILFTVWVVFNWSFVNNSRMVCGTCLFGWSLRNPQRLCPLRTLGPTLLYLIRRINVYDHSPLPKKVKRIRMFKGKRGCLSSEHRTVWRNSLDTSMNIY